MNYKLEQLVEDSRQAREDKPDLYPQDCPVESCKFYNGDFLDYNCDDSSGISFICACPNRLNMLGKK